MAADAGSLCHQVISSSGIDKGPIFLHKEGFQISVLSMVSNDR